MVSLDAGCLRRAVIALCEEVAGRRWFDREWSQCTEEDLWHELVSCILGSQVRHEQAVAATRRLREQGLLAPASITCLDDFEARVAEALSGHLPCDLVRCQKYRFPRLRAQHLRRTFESLYLSGLSLCAILSSSRTAAEARLKIMSVAVGVGPKQASLFLRNVGFGDDLAILDSHVLHFMQWIGLASRTATPGDIRDYEETEAALRSYADYLGFKLVHVDLAIWVVTRVLRREVRP